MCFLPNRRASKDQAPGPIIARAAQRLADMIVIQGSPECQECREKAIHSLTTTASAPATGVHKPIRRSIPATIPMICKATVVNGGPSIRLAIPKLINTAAVSTRRIRRPTPGQPLANVENRRCRIKPRLQSKASATLLKRMKVGSDYPTLR